MPRSQLPLYQDYNLSRNQIENGFWNSKASDPAVADLSPGEEWFNIAAGVFKKFDGNNIVAFIPRVESDRVPEITDNSYPVGIQWKFGDRVFQLLDINVQNEAVWLDLKDLIPVAVSGGSEFFADPILGVFAVADIPTNNGDRYILDTDVTVIKVVGGADEPLPDGAIVGLLDSKDLFKRVGSELEEVGASNYVGDYESLAAIATANPESQKGQYGIIRQETIPAILYVSRFVGSSYIWVPERRTGNPNNNPYGNPNDPLVGLTYYATEAEVPTSSTQVSGRDYAVYSNPDGSYGLKRANGGGNFLDITIGSLASVVITEANLPNDIAADYDLNPNGAVVKLEEVFLSHLAYYNGDEWIELANSSELKDVENSLNDTVRTVTRDRVPTVADNEEITTNWVFGDRVFKQVGNISIGGAPETIGELQPDFNDLQQSQAQVGTPIWQSFTPGVSGLITSFRFAGQYFNEIPTRFNIYEGVGNGGVLVETEDLTIPSGNPAGFNPTLTFTKAIQVTGNQVYTIEIAKPEFAGAPPFLNKRGASYTAAERDYLPGETTDSGNDDYLFELLISPVTGAYWLELNELEPKIEAAQAESLNRDRPHYSHVTQITEPTLNGANTEVVLNAETKIQFYSNHASPDWTEVAYPAQNIPIPVELQTNTIVYLTFNQDGSISAATLPLVVNQLNTRVPFCILETTDSGATISKLTSAVIDSSDYNKKLLALGGIVKSDRTNLLPIDGTKTFSFTGGVIEWLGQNYFNDANAASSLSIANQAIATFDVYRPNNVIDAAGITEFDFGRYWNGNSVSTFSGNDCTNYHIYLLPDGTLRAVMGRIRHTSYNNANRDTWKDTARAEILPGFENSILLGLLIGRQDYITTDNLNRLNFIPTSNLGKVQQAAAAGSTNTAAIEKVSGVTFTETAANSGIFEATVTSNDFTDIGSINIFGSVVAEFTGVAELDNFCNKFRVGNSNNQIRLTSLKEITNASVYFTGI